MTEEELNKNQKDSLQQLLLQGGTLEALTKQDGWKYIQQYFQTKVQAFTNELLVSEKPIAEFEDERREIIGLRKLLGWIEHSIQAVQDDRDKAKKPTAK